MKIVFNKADNEGNEFTAVKGRFHIEASRTDSGYIRGWRVVDRKPGTLRKDDGFHFAKNRKAAKAWIESRLRSEPPEDLKAKVEAEIKMILHAHRDCLRNQDVDTTKVRFDVRDGYYGEAFGILRCLKLMGFGDFGPVNIQGNLSYWMHQLEEEVLKEENFGGSGVCEHCRSKYGKDDALVAERKAS